MTFFIFAGDLLVMAFMTVLVVWLLLKTTQEHLDEASRIPLEDDHADG